MLARAQDQRQHRLLRLGQKEGSVHLGDRDWHRQAAQPRERWFFLGGGGLVYLAMLAGEGFVESKYNCVRQVRRVLFRRSAVKAESISWGGKLTINVPVVYMGRDV